MYLEHNSIHFQNRNNFPNHVGSEVCCDLCRVSHICDAQNEQIFRKQRLNGSLLRGNSSGRSANYSAKGQGYQEQRIEIERTGRWHLIEHKK